jgi:hypothetical protein
MILTHLHSGSTGAIAEWIGDSIKGERLKQAIGFFALEGWLQVEIWRLLVRAAAATGTSRHAVLGNEHPYWTRFAATKSVTKWKAADLAVIDNRTMSVVLLELKTPAWRPRLHSDQVRTVAQDVRALAGCHPVNTLHGICERDTELARSNYLLEHIEDLQQRYDAWTHVTMRGISVALFVEHEPAMPTDLSEDIARHMARSRTPELSELSCSCRRIQDRVSLVVTDASSIGLGRFELGRE